MALKEELERQGNWLFRWRSYLPLVLVPLLPAALVERDASGMPLPSREWMLICMGVSFLGLALRVFTVGYVPRGTSGRNTLRQMASTVNTTGMYSLCRHPLYLGNFVIWLGVAMTVQFWWVVAIMALAFWVYYERIMIAEEEYVRGQFGRDYEEWADRTPAFFPRLSGWRPPSLPFSLKAVLKREYSGFFGIIAMFTFLEAIRVRLAAGAFRLDPLWLAIFLSGLAVYLVLITMKKRHLLEVEGR